MSLLTKTKSLLPKGRGSKWGGWMEGKGASLPGEVCHGLNDSRREAGVAWQESAEAIVSGWCTTAEGPNVRTREGTE